MAMGLASYGPSVNGGYSGTPQFGPGHLTQLSSGLTGRPEFPLDVFQGATTMQAAPMDIDKGQLSCSWQFISSKECDPRLFAAGIGKHDLFFLHTPQDAPHLRRELVKAVSLSDLNKLIFKDAEESRAQGAARPTKYHAPEARTPNLHTCEAIMRDWAMMGVCTATEGADEVVRSTMDKVVLSAIVGGKSTCFNYWSVRNSDSRCWLLLKLVRVITDSYGGAVPGCYEDLSERAQWTRDRVGAFPDEVSDAKRCRVENAARAARVLDPMVVWQYVPYVADGAAPPPVSEYRGCYTIEGVDGQPVVVNWVGAAIRCGRSHFAEHQGSSMMQSRGQIDAALQYTHPFETSAGGVSIFTNASTMAGIGTFDLLMYV